MNMTLQHHLPISTGANPRACTAQHTCVIKNIFEPVLILMWPRDTNVQVCIVDRVHNAEKYHLSVLCACTHCGMV